MKLTAVAVLFAFLACASVANASVTGVDLADDNDGVITCTTDWNDGAGSVSIDGTHDILDAGHVEGTITTSSANDPMLTMMNTIDNETGLDWIGYHVNVSMNNAFAISGDYVSLPADWASTITSQPVDVGGGLYVGQIDYTAGTPLANGGTLDFGYSISFSGLTNFTFQQEMIPVSVPEPTTMALVGCGLLGLFALRRRSA